MRAVEVKRRAQSDLEAIARGFPLTREDYAAARRLIAEIITYCGRLAANPAIIGSLEPRLARATRRLEYKGYKIYVRYSRNRLTVLRIVHARRNFP